jgi:hypothetical protein
VSVEAGNKHRAIVLIAAGLVARKDWRFTPFRGHVPQPFTEAAGAKLGGTSKELD